MIIILSQPTEFEIEILKRIVGDKQIELINDKEKLSDKEEAYQEWIRSKVFVKKLLEKGFRCQSSKTRKKICDTYGLKYILKGKELWFQNELDKVPSRIRTK